MNDFFTEVEWLLHDKPFADLIIITTGSLRGGITEYLYCKPLFE